MISIVTEPLDALTLGSTSSSNGGSLWMATAAWGGGGGGGAGGYKMWPGKLSHLYILTPHVQLSSCKGGRHD